ncbi:efflux RND transporter periplasmic adaptor subunit [Aliidiomarina sp.]|uniref:efflux RND transporter periplasmic adaptor subunit n=1 Tax=Aliidiomarina sp. TaxID=1872439 RepID=UPI003A4DF269
MIKVNTVNAIAVLFVVLIASTLALGVVFQAPAHGGHAHEQGHEQGHEHSDEHNHVHNHDRSDNNASSSAQDQAVQQAFSSTTQEYTCSMHPHFRSTDPNERCPICGMELIPVAASNGGNDEFVRIEFSGRSLALLGLQTEPVQRGNAQHEVRLSGQIEFDESALTSISAWTGGRIERLFVNYTGAHVTAQQPLLELYSPELLVAQQELLQAHRQLQQNGPEFLRDSQATTYRAARERLRLLGLSGTQIDAVISSGEVSDRITIYAPSAGLVVTRNIRQGDYVNTGDTLLELANESKLWALFEVFERDLAFIQRGQHLQFQLGNTGQSFHGQVVSIAPRIDAERRTRAVRVALTNTGNTAMVPGAFTRATVQINIEDVLSIPASAALITGIRAVVYVQINVGEFEARTVELGRRLGDRYEVLDGLTDDELIVSRGAFRIDSELQLRGRPSMMAPEGGGATGHEQHGHGAAQDEHTNDEPAGHADTSDNHAINAAANNRGADHSEPAISFTSSLQLAPLFSAYHGMWEALHSDSLSDWQSAALEFYAAVGDVTWPSNFSTIAQQLSVGLGHAHHVSNIRAARDQFYSHSQAMIALAEAGFHEGELHLMFCPMARRGDGAYWLQESDTLLNPYFGDRMLRCGDVVRALTGHASESGGHAQ